jgi:DNA replication protein DnaC
MKKASDIIGNDRLLRLMSERRREIVVDADPSPAQGKMLAFPKANPANLPTCPTCKCPLDGEKHWLRDYSQSDGKHFGYSEVPCPDCSGDIDAKRYALRKARLVSTCFGESQIPFQAKNWTFETYPKDADQHALQIVRAFVRTHLTGADTESKRGLYIGGDTGRCKSSLAISALKEALFAGQPGLFVMTMELMDKLRATFGKDQSVTQDQLLDAVASIPWLVLDDLAVEKPTRYVIEKLYFIIEKRRSKGLYTIITSNLTTTRLEEYWRPEGVDAGAFYPGLRVIERLREYCDGVGVRGRNQRQADW